MVTTALTQGVAVSAGENLAAETQETRLIALLGRRDEPTDALRDYCARLGEALHAHGATLTPVEFLWDQNGWLASFVKLWKASSEWAGRWVLLQYTALMWSRRGFPTMVLPLLILLRLRKCRIAVIFHDVYAVPGSRWIDRFRVAFQRGIMRTAYHLADRSIVPIPLDVASWLPKGGSKASLIPVGANIPSREDLLRESSASSPPNRLTVTVFGVSSWPVAQKQEIEAIVYSIREACAHVGALHLLVIGRGAKEAEPALRKGLSDTQVTLTVDGLLEDWEVSARLCESDVQLFVRGPLSSRRGSGVAGIACELPIVAYQGPMPEYPLTEAGIVFVPQDDLKSLANQLSNVLTDRELRQNLAARNQAVFRKWYSWDCIAARLIETLTAASGVS